MKFSLETIGRLLASGRNYTNYFMGVATTLGLMSAAQSKTVTESLNEIVVGVGQIVHGFTSIWQVGVVVLGPVVTIVLAKWASNSAKTTNQQASVTASANDPNDPKAKEAKVAILDAAASLPEVSKPIVVSDPTLASAVPSPKVVS